MKKQVAIFTGLVSVDENLVGTAVIYKKMADIFLSQGYKVFMVVPEESNLQNTKINFSIYNKKNNQKIINNSHLVVFGAYPPLDPLLYAYSKNKIIMTYLWSIAPIGSLEFKDFKKEGEQKNLHQFISASYNMSLLLSDKIFCRDEGVRRIVLGSLISLGRLNLDNYKNDKSFTSLIEVAPFGLEKDKPKKGPALYRNLYPGIDKDDFILLWNGGIWNWNDGLTLIKAMAKLKNKKIKLIFQGFKHPGKGKELSRAAQESLDLANNLGLNGKNVFFMDKWIPYRERGRFLLESDAGIISSPNIPEANFFFKTRIYDYFWSELPIILNDCEAFAPLVSEKELGLIVKTGDANDLAKKIIILSKDKNLYQKIKKNIREFKKEISWEKTLTPVKNFAKNPQALKDKKDLKNKLIQKNIILNSDF